MPFFGFFSSIILEIIIFIQLILHKYKDYFYIIIEISLTLVRDAVKAALKDQKDAHDDAIQKLMDDHKISTLPSPLSGTNLTKASGLSYNKMGGISSTPLATMPRPSFSTSVGTSTASSGGSTQVPTSQDYFQNMSLSQSQVEQDLTQRPDDPVTERGLYARLQAFDDYNELGGRKGLREVMGVK